jgi:fucokinase
MPTNSDLLQRIWHSTVYRWNRKRLGRRKRRPFWDVVILTAANLTQARGYEIELERRRDLGMIDPQTQVVVVPDRAGKRIGSGGATLWALKHYARESLAAKSTAPKSIEELFEGKRVLMIHCGGEGRRVPSNVGTGKLFASLPFEVIAGRAASAFDALYVFLSACAEQMTDGLVVVSGDVLAVFDPARLHWKRGGCSGIGIPASFELASQHGIYIPDSQNRRVMNYLQKVPPAQMIKREAAYDKNRALVDGAGILRFSPQVCAKLADLAGLKNKNGKILLTQGLIENPKRKEGGPKAPFFQNA